MSSQGPGSGSGPGWQWSDQHGDYIGYDQYGRLVTGRQQQAQLAAMQQAASQVNNPRVPRSGPGPGPGNQQMQASGSGQQPLRPNYTYTPGGAGPSRATPQARVLRDLDQRTGKVQVLQTSPANETTDPAFLRLGKHAKGRLIQSDDHQITQKLFPDFKVADNPARFFRIGRVFIVLWVEPAGESRATDRTLITSEEEAISTGRFGERVFSKVRRFVVIKESVQFCSALPIVSYGRQGVSKPRTVKSDHGIIHIGATVPQPLPEELPQHSNEQPMRSIAIRVDPDSRTERLEPMSRINYGKFYTIEHNVKVRSIGFVSPGSIAALQAQAFEVFSGSQPPATQVPTPLPDREALISALIGRGYSRTQAIEILGAQAARVAAARQAAGEEHSNNQPEDDEDEDENEDELEVATVSGETSRHAAGTGRQVSLTTAMNNMRVSAQQESQGRQVPRQQRRDTVMQGNSYTLDQYATGMTRPSYQPSGSQDGEQSSEDEGEASESDDDARSPIGSQSTGTRPISIPARVAHTAQFTRPSASPASYASSARSPPVYPPRQVYGSPLRSAGPAQQNAQSTSQAAALRVMQERGMSLAEAQQALAIQARRQQQVTAGRFTSSQTHARTSSARASATVTRRPVLQVEREVNDDSADDSVEEDDEAVESSESEGG